MTNELRHKQMNICVNKNRQIDKFGHKSKIK